MRVPNFDRILLLLFIPLFLLSRPTSSFLRPLTLSSAPQLHFATAATKPKPTYSCRPYGTTTTHLPVLNPSSTPLVPPPDTPGEDSASFSLSSQSPVSWLVFTAATGAVLSLVSYLWFLPSGPHLGDSYLASIQSLQGSTDSTLTMFNLMLIFSVVHSGLAALRPYNPLGQRAHRVIFALASLPLSLSSISYFVNHSHDLPHYTSFSVPHPLLFGCNLLSFLLLYPSTFNLLEVAAVDPPRLHLWGTGVARITRHPQAVGQIVWCGAHCAYLNSGVAYAASAVLVGHHLFSVWHGDRRLEEEHGDEFRRVKDVTSVVPFQAVWEGRQVLPEDYYKEWLRAPYLVVVGGTLAAYAAHPLMMGGAAILGW